MSQTSDFTDFVDEKDVLEWFEIENSIVAVTKSGICMFNSTTNSSSDVTSHSEYKFLNFKNICSLKYIEDYSVESPEYEGEKSILIVSSLIGVFSFGVMESHAGIAFPVIVISAVFFLLAVVSMFSKSKTEKQGSKVSIKTTDHTENWTVISPKVSDEDMISLVKVVSRKINN
jgi:hypothetical protein